MAAAAAATALISARLPPVRLRQHKRQRVDSLGDTTGGFQHARHQQQQQQQQQHGAATAHDVIDLTSDDPDPPSATGQQHQQPGNLPLPPQQQQQHQQTVQTMLPAQQQPVRAVPMHAQQTGAAAGAAHMAAAVVASLAPAPSSALKMPEITSLTTENRRGLVTALLALINHMHAAGPLSLSQQQHRQLLLQVEALASKLRSYGQEGGPAYHRSSWEGQLLEDYSFLMSWLPVGDMQLLQGRLRTLLAKAVG
jgi:hypothetical protein